MEKYKALSNLEKEITKKLFNPWIENYKNYAKEILFALDQNIEITNDDKNKIINIINNWIQQFPKNPTHSQVINFVHKEFRKINNIEWNNSLHYIVKNIAKDEWLEIQNDLHIQPPLDGMLYRWWVARNILRKILWIKENEFDSEINDIDAFIIPSLDKQKITQLYNTWSDWISYIEDLDRNTIKEKLWQVDCNINQVLVSQSQIYYTNSCELWLKDNYIRPAGEWKNIYNTLSYSQWDNVIYSSSIIIRAIKFLCEQKVNSLTVKNYNIDPYNFKQLKPDNDILALVRKFIYKNNANELLCNLNDILQQINFFWEDYTDITDYIEQQLIQKPYFSFIDRPANLQREANRLLTKIIKNYKHSIIDSIKDIWEPNIIITPKQLIKEDKIITLNHNTDWEVINRLSNLIEKLKTRW